MSTFAISQSNHAWCLGLGGAAGQAWSGLEAVQERLAAGHETEALLMAGDQECVDGSETGLGVALLFSACPKPYSVSGRRVTLLAIKRERKPHAKLCVPHAAAGLSRLLSRIKGTGAGRCRMKCLLKIRTESMPSASHWRSSIGHEAPRRDYGNGRALRAWRDAGRAMERLDDRVSRASAEYLI